MAVRIFRNYWQLPMVVLAGVELVLFAFAFYLAALWRFDGDIRQITVLLPGAVLFCLIMSLSMASMGLYSARQTARPTGLLIRIGTAVVCATSLMAIVSYVEPTLYIGRGVMLLCMVMYTLGSLACHVLLERLTNEDAFRRRVLVYGAGSRAATLMKLRRRTDLRGFSLIGFVPAVGDQSQAVGASRRLNITSSLLELCNELGVVEIVVAMDDRRRAFPFKEFLECRIAGIQVTELVTFLERETGKVRLDVLNPSWMIFSDGFRRNSLQTSLERLFDLTASVLLLLLTWPLMIVTMLAIKLEDGWHASILYRQVRVGEHGRPFWLLKFRSMREDAEREGGARWAATHDERVTRVGALIRHLRVDELPQIFNVLTGEMSLVGPRPERPEFVSTLSDEIPFYRERHTIKPGVTGWAQLCYPYGSSVKDAAEKLQYDLFYIKNRNLLFYLAVLVQTVEVILWGKGAR